jgi:hypothetical protein
VENAAVTDARREDSEVSLTAVPVRWRGRRLGRAILSVTAVLGLVVVVIAAWLAIWVHSAWARLDRGADKFAAGPPFDVVAHVRQGTALCFVSCTHGGDATVTVVMTVDGDVADACAKLQERVGAVASAPAVEAPGDFACDFSAPLGGGAMVRGVVAMRSQLRPLGPASTGRGGPNRLTYRTPRCWRGWG